jgi:D-serine deaminase-like pyridoxal phosphate-dependent protein
MNNLLLKEPTLLVDKQKCIANIKMMKAKAEKANVIFRPHFKTHQSATVGEWFREEGVEKITVSSIKMAKYFADNGWNDITIAFPTNILEIDDINTLAERITLNLQLESMGVARFLESYLNSNVNVFIKIDSGYHRTGIWCENIQEIETLVEEINKSERLNLLGFLTHSGQNYNAANEKEILDNHAGSLRIMSEIKGYFKEKYPNLIASIGDTPGCSLAEAFHGIDEIRPGNFVFYDLQQFILDTCHDTDIALVMSCPVVAKHQERNEIVIYGGGVHLSKEFIPTGEEKLFGSLVKFDDKGWTQILSGGYLASLSQEHGIIRVNDDLFKEIDMGEQIGIVPVHSCMTVSCMPQMFTTEGEELDMLK